MSTKSVLITTKADDVHAVIVETALERIGWNCFRWVSSDLPTCQSVSICFDSDSAPYVRIHSETSSNEIDLHPEDLVVWNRRYVENPLIDDKININDRKIAERDVNCLRDNLLFIFNNAITRINDLACARRAENKGLQLHVAREIGFSIPETCISNSPGAIRNFIRQFPRGGCLAKPFKAGMWERGGEILVGYSAIVEVDQLPDDIYIQSSPMIFQEYIEKSFEARITFFGNAFVAVKLHSQNDVRSVVDWRTVSPRYLDVELTAVPKEIEARCFSMMRTLGLSFGCFDFAIDNSGKWIFLELNQMGQFLWIEQENREIPMLDMFLQLLTRGPERVSSIPHYGVEFDMVAADAYARLDKEKTNHAKLNPVGFVREVN